MFRDARCFKLSLISLVFLTRRLKASAILTLELAMTSKASTFRMSYSFSPAVSVFESFRGRVVQTCWTVEDGAEAAGRED